jgi:N-acetylglucosaminyldiphosphoundecaprenol N-acetyl-beta-D-mannosaminyltransferase
MNELLIVEVMGFKVLNDDLNKVNFEGRILVNTISPNSYGISTSDKKFEVALKNSDILTLDGEYFGLASLLLKGERIRKQQGPDNFRCFMRKVNNISGRAFFLGSSDKTLSLMKERAKIEYPNVQVEVYSPPYKPEFSEKDNQLIIKKINQFRPHLLCVGMTAPKQEKWAYEHYQKLEVNVVITIGQVFDWFAGTMDEPNPIWSKMHLLWLIRTIKRPEILKRYPMVFKFFWHLLLNIMHVRRY